MRLSDAAHQAWPPFVLVSGLLLIGIVANADGLFELVGGLLEGLPGSATVLLSAHALPHPRALLIGLNIGPNLAVTGSLSAYLWLRAARQVGASPSIKAYSRRGVVLAPLAMLAALAATSVFSSPS